MKAYGKGQNKIERYFRRKVIKEYGRGVQFRSIERGAKEN